jgi:3-oxoacyl-[acyl-carrier-protein] synthase II
MRDRQRVVVTGIGPVTAVGTGRDAFWSGLRNERSGIKTITRFDSSPFNSHIAAEVSDFEPAHYMESRRAQRLDRYSQFAIASARLAMEDAGLAVGDADPERFAVQIGSALGGIGHAEAQSKAFLENGVKSVDPRVAITTFGGAASCNIAIEFGCQGPNATNAMSCASGTMAIGEAWRLIADGTADVAIAGGVEAPLSTLSFGAFAIIRALSRRNDSPGSACRPFDRDRDGFVMGEGANCLVLESEEHARARGAKPYAQLLGYGNTNDAHSMTAPRPDGTQASRAITIALERADLAPEDIDYVNAHASSTPLNDSTETRAIRSALGNHAGKIPVSGTKPYHGHALGASGAIEAGVVCLSMTRNWLPPTLNHDHPGPECDLDYVPNRGRHTETRVVLSNSLGFGGINACLLFGAA